MSAVWIARWITFSILYVMSVKVATAEMCVNIIWLPMFGAGCSPVSVTVYESLLSIRGCCLFWTPRSRFGSSTIPSAKAFASCRAGTYFRNGKADDAVQIVSPEFPCVVRAYPKASVMGDNSVNRRSERHQDPKSLKLKQVECAGHRNSGCSKLSAYACQGAFHPDAVCCWRNALFYPHIPRTAVCLW